jgi:hypothetical protein
MTSESGLRLGGRARRRVRIAAVGLIAAAAVLSAPGDAERRGHREAMSPAVERGPVADRTLVPKRIRLIIGWKRPRLA